MNLHVGASVDFHTDARTNVALFRDGHGADEPRS